MASAMVFHEQLLSFFAAPFYQQQTVWHKVDVQRQRISNRTLKPFIYELDLEATLWDGDPAARTVLVPPGGSIDLAVVSDHDSLALFTPTEGIAAALKLTFWASLVVTSPAWFWALLQFVVPALYDHERRLVFPFVGGAIFCMIVGFLVAYSFVVPATNHYLYTFNASFGRNVWSLAHYLDYTIFLMFACAAGCQLAFLLFFAVHYGLLSVEVMVAKRRLAVVAAFILGALLTPPDVFSQILVAIPLIAAYELAIIYGRYRAVQQ
jgi:sec-independent protein translocase protein TatC